MRSLIGGTRFVLCTGGTMMKWSLIPCLAATVLVVPFASTDSASATEHFTGVVIASVNPASTGSALSWYAVDPTGCALCENVGEGFAAEHKFKSASMPEECDTLVEQQQDENCRKCDSNGFCHQTVAPETCDYSDHVGEIHPRCAMPEEEARSVLQVSHLLEAHDLTGIAEIIAKSSAIAWYPERRALQAITPCGRVHWQETLSKESADAMTASVTR